MDATHALAFSAEVASERWLADATEWIDRVAGSRGVRVMEVQRGRVRPWSAQLTATVAGEEGPEQLWFKANCRAQAFEPALQRLLAELVPDAVDAPVAVKADRGWMLTADRGPTLREQHAPTHDDWARVLAGWATVQRLSASAGGRVLAAGVPDCSPPTIPARFELMLERVLALPPDHPSSPDATTATALERARDRVAEAAARLDASGWPSALQHGDLHPGNVFASTAAGLRVFDFGDAQWAHPLEAVLVPYGVMEHAGLDPAPAFAAFRRVWTDRAGTGARVDDAAWEELVAAAEITHAVNRAFTWWDCLAQADAAETTEWGEAVLRHLSRVLG